MSMAADTQGARQFRDSRIALITDTDIGRNTRGRINLRSAQVEITGCPQPRAAFFIVRREKTHVATTVEGDLVDATTLARMGEVSMATHDDATLRIPTRFALGFMKSMDNRRVQNRCFWVSQRLHFQPIRSFRRRRSKKQPVF